MSSFEQFELGNDCGASEDHSRIIRHRYDSADYTALTPSAYESWEELEEETGLRLVLRAVVRELVHARRAEVARSRPPVRRTSRSPSPPELSQLS